MQNKYKLLDIAKNYFLQTIDNRGRNKKNQIEDAYPERKILEPKLLRIGMFDAVVIESSALNHSSINFVGYNKAMYMDFDINVETEDQKLDGMDILLLLVNSISIQRKN